jgi:tRNA (cmo5U34)-methyltransferase
MTASEPDRLYADALAAVERFVFDERVAAVFPDMIRRSVPGYATVIGMLGVIAEQYAQPHSCLYDLGCSLGAATAVMRARVRAPDCRFVAVDNAPAMVARARESLESLPGPPVQVQCADIREVPVSDASVVVLNYTLQFIPPARRQALLARIRAGMRPGGVLVLSEKIQGADPEEDRRLIALHHAFKRANGYSELEISQKRAALEQVLIPETLAAHRARLHGAGFCAVDVWFQCCNFASLLAYR